MYVVHSELQALQLRYLSNCVTIVLKKLEHSNVVLYENLLFHITEQILFKSFVLAHSNLLSSVMSISRSVSYETYYN